MDTTGQELRRKLLAHELRTGARVEQLVRRLQTLERRWDKLYVLSSENDQAQVGWWASGCTWATSGPTALSETARTWRCTWREWVRLMGVRADLAQHVARAISTVASVPAVLHPGCPVLGPLVVHELIARRIARDLRHVDLRRQGCQWQRWTNDPNMSTYTRLCSCGFSVCLADEAMDPMGEIRNNRNHLRRTFPERLMSTRRSRARPRE